MKYYGKYWQMAMDMREDHMDEDTIEKIIRAQMDEDDFHENTGNTDPKALKIWESWPEEKRQMILSKCISCMNCGITSFDEEGYTVRFCSKRDHSLLLEGFCAKCGKSIGRVCENQE